MTPRLDRRPVLVALCSGVGSYFVGLEVRDALLLGLALGVLTAAFVIAEIGQDDDWTDARDEVQDGTRANISAMTWSFIGRDGRVSEAAVRHLRVAAARRLARHGVVLPGGLRTGTFGVALEPQTQERARALLGDRAWRVLRSTSGGLPSLADVAHCIEVIEGLGTNRPIERPHP